MLSLSVIGSAVPLWCAPASLANFWRSRRLMKLITRCLLGLFKIANRKNYDTKVYSKCFGLTYRGTLSLFFMIACIGWSCPVAKFTNVFWAVWTVETYVKPKIAKAQFLQLFQLPYSSPYPECPASLSPTSTSPKTVLENLIGNSLFTRNPN